MSEIFDKNLYRDSDKKVKVIIDTDPGVDDTACLIYALADSNIEVKLLTTVAGNISVDTSTRNLLHLLDILGRDIPVAKGAKSAMNRISPTAEFIHGKEGLGGYFPPKEARKKIIDEDAVSAMYRVLKEGDGDIFLVALGPQTNIATLLQKHPDIKDKIPKIVIMGGSPFGNPDYFDHISFNTSSDPEAYGVLLASGIPLLVAPSHIGRFKTHLDEKFVFNLKNFGDIGKLLFSMYQKYWEPNYPTKRVTTNDTAALFSLVYPKLFVTKKIKASVNTDDAPGKTSIEFVNDGNILFVHDVDREAFLSLLTSELEKMKDIKLGVDFKN